MIILNYSDYQSDTRTYTSAFDELYRALLRHPSLIVSEKSLNNFDTLYSSLSSTIYDYSTFVDAASALTGFFEDGHTNIEIPYTKCSRCLPFSCTWDGDKLLLTETYDAIPTGAQITAIEGIYIGDIVQRMASRIPHENIYLVKSRMVHYPYQNYHVFSEMNLQWLFGTAEEFSISFCVNNMTVTQECPLVKYDGYLDFPSDDHFVSFDISGNTATLRLDACLDNDTYKQTLHKLAVVCSEQKIESLTLDLSRNMGGSSAVIDEFIRYVNIPYYRRYEMVDYSTGAAAVITKRTDLVENKLHSVLFPKKIYCKVSHDTFSSARTFAVTLKDNGIATIIGTPTGGKPNSYGSPQKRFLPYTKIRFRISTCLFLRPDKSLDAEMSLQP